MSWKSLQKDPDLDSQVASNSDVQQHFIFIRNATDRDEQLVRIIQQYIPDEKILIFVERRDTCTNLSSMLKRMGLNAAGINAHCNPTKRAKALDAFCRGAIPVLVLTDMNLDIDFEGLAVVVSYDIANSEQRHCRRVDWINSSEKTGLSLTFVSRICKDFQMTARILDGMKESGEFPSQEVQKVIDRLQQYPALLKPKNDQQRRNFGGGFGSRLWEDDELYDTGNDCEDETDGGDYDDELQQVEEELRQTQEHLQSTREELQHSQQLHENCQQRLTQTQQRLRSVEGQLRQSQRQVQQEQSDKTDAERTLNELLIDYQGHNREILRLRNTNEELRQRLQRLERSSVDGCSRCRLRSSSRNSTEEDLVAPAKDWILRRAEIEMTVKEIGKGGWGSVKVGKLRGTKVAVKQIYDVILSAYNRQLFEREMSMASRCRHPHLVQFIGATNDNASPLYVMELMETNLRSLLSRNKLKDQESIDIGYDIIRALNYLHLSHPSPIIHRDVSSANVLLYHGKGNWRAKLSDFGSASFARSLMTANSGAQVYSAPVKCTLHRSSVLCTGQVYSAPEAGTPNQTTKIDVYSFGILLCEMCTGRMPIPAHRAQDIASVTHYDLRSLISQCTAHAPAGRPTAADVVQQFERGFGANFGVRWLGWTLQPSEVSETR